MLYKVYSAQKVSQVQGDWVELLEADKSMFKINLSDDEMEKMSKYKLQKYLKKMSIEVTLGYIEGLKAKHSKVEKYDTSKLSTSEYLTDNRFSRSEHALLFKLWSRMVQVKYNFQNGNLGNMLCDLCNLFTCTQEHILSCPVLTVKCTIVNSISIAHSFIYGSVDQQLAYMKIYGQFWEERKQILESKTQAK